MLVAHIYNYDLKIKNPLQHEIMRDLSVVEYAVEKHSHFTACLHCNDIK